MGNESSRLVRCGSSRKRAKSLAQGEAPGQEGGECMIIEENSDGYFSKDDYSHIKQKYPQYREWIESALTHSAKGHLTSNSIRWKQGELIGMGSYGKVYTGLNSDTGTIMAIKQVVIGGNSTLAQEERAKSLEMEIELLSQFDHPNIVRYYGCAQNQNTMNIFLEYISGGTLASLIDRYGQFNETLIKVYTRQILEGLEYLHARNTIHRDIKGANILVDNNGICKLTDFGTAKRIVSLVENVDDSKYTPSIRGTVNWMAPEIIKQNFTGRQCDIWSVGCTVLEMATGKAPWANLKGYGNSYALMYQIAQSKTHPPFPKGLSSDCIDFLKQCFKLNPRERPNVVKLLQHKFVQGVDSLTKKFTLTDEEKEVMSKSPFKSAGVSKSQPKKGQHYKYESINSSETNNVSVRVTDQFNSAPETLQHPASSYHKSYKPDQSSEQKSTFGQMNIIKEESQLDESVAGKSSKKHVRRPSTKPVYYEQEEQIEIQKPQDSDFDQYFPKVANAKKNVSGQSKISAQSTEATQTHGTLSTKPTFSTVDLKIQPRLKVGKKSVMTNQQRKTKGYQNLNEEDQQGQKKKNTKSPVQLLDALEEDEPINFYNGELKVEQEGHHDDQVTHSKSKDSDKDPSVKSGAKSQQDNSLRTIHLSEKMSIRMGASQGAVKNKLTNGSVKNENNQGTGKRFGSMVLNQSFEAPKGDKNIGGDMDENSGEDESDDDDDCDPGQLHIIHRWEDDDDSVEFDKDVMGRPSLQQAEDEQYDNKLKNYSEKFDHLASENDSSVALKKEGSEQYSRTGLLGTTVEN